MMDPLNLVLLAVAVFVIWRLYGVLGTRTGHERPPFDPLAGRTGQADSTPVAGPRTLPPQNDDAAAETPDEEREPVWKGYAAEGSTLAQGLEAIAGADRNFAPKPFMDGAKLAYEMIIEAYARGDKITLKPLLNRDVFDGFAAEIEARSGLGEVMETSFVGFQKAELVSAVLAGSRAGITLKFVAEMITTTKNSAGELVDGDPRKVREVTDTWTFERDVTSKDPNWRLAATEEPA